MEIERKFLVEKGSFEYEKYPYKELVQGYLNTAPVVRVRREGDEYYLTYKGSGLMIREEYNLPLTKEAFEHLIKKADGNIIKKKRFFVPLGDLTVELDEFAPPFAPLLMAEVEFATKEAAENFTPPMWFGKEVTNDPEYHNSNMASKVL